MCACVCECVYVFACACMCVCMCTSLCDDLSFKTCPVEAPNVSWLRWYSLQIFDCDTISVFEFMKWTILIRWRLEHDFEAEGLRFRRRILSFFRKTRPRRHTIQLFVSRKNLRIAILLVNYPDSWCITYFTNTFRYRYINVQERVSYAMASKKNAAAMNFAREWDNTAPVHVWAAAACSWHPTTPLLQCYINFLLIALLQLFHVTAWSNLVPMA